MEGSLFLLFLPVFAAPAVPTLPAALMPSPEPSPSTLPLPDLYSAPLDWDIPDNETKLELNGSSSGPLGGEGGFLLSAEQRKEHTDLGHSIVFVKTHKTASTTIAQIFYRMADWRGLKVMLPTDVGSGGVNLNWPHDVPWPRLEPGFSARLAPLNQPASAFLKT